jgi:hypothetical protein
MPTSVDICWGHGTAQPSTRDELDAILATVRARGVPETVYMRNAARECLAFGIGFGASAVSFADAAGRTSLSHGDPALADAPSVTVRDGVTPATARTLVPESDAVAAAHEFLANGGRPRVVAWADDAHPPRRA